MICIARYLSGIRYQISSSLYIKKIIPNSRYFLWISVHCTRQLAFVSFLRLVCAMNRNTSYQLWSPSGNRTENRTCLKKSATTTGPVHVPTCKCACWWGSDSVPQPSSSERFVCLCFIRSAAVVESIVNRNWNWNFYSESTARVAFARRAMWAEACNHAYRELICCKGKITKYSPKSRPAASDGKQSS